MKNATSCFWYCPCTFQFPSEVEFRVNNILLWGVQVPELIHFFDLYCFKVILKMISETKNSIDDMHTDFNKQFKIGKKFESVEDLKSTILSFGKDHHVVFSIKDSHPNRGEYRYICKHGGTKREITCEKDSADDESVETIDLTTDAEPVVVEEATTIKATKKPYKKSTQKLGCPAYINLFGLVVTSTKMEHDHLIPEDVITYAIHRKQPPEIMKRIYTILASGHRDPVTSVLDVGAKQYTEVQFAHCIFLDIGSFRHQEYQEKRHSKHSNPFFEE